MIDNKTVLARKKLFNETGDIEVHLRKMIGGNTTNLNDFNNMKYTWASEWYRQAMNNFWIPEEINMNTDVQDYRKLSPAEKTAYDKILSFLIFLDSIQTAVHHGERGEPVSDYSSISGSGAFAELQLHARHHLFPR